MFATQFGIEIRRYSAKPTQDFNRTIDFAMPPRVGQNEVYSEVVQRLDSIGGVTLKLGTGQGKTWIVSKLVWNYWKHTIIFVINKDLQAQVCAEIKNLLPGLPICQAGGFAKTGDKKLFADFVDGVWEYDYPFVCVSVNKTANNLATKHGTKIWSRFHLAIYDECQSFCNDTGEGLLRYCQPAKKVALSATPDQNWNSNLIYLWCGPLFDGNELMPKSNVKGTVKIIKYYGPKHLSESQKDDYNTNNYSNTLRLIEQDEFRMNMGIAEIRTLHEEGLVPIVFFQHLNYMHRVADEYAKKYGFEVGILEGATPEQDREFIKANAEIIFTIYKFGAVGLNAPRIKSMLLMEPHKTLGKQVNGRPMRDTSDTIRKYVDIVDMVSFLGRQLGVRMEDYVARDFEISEVVIKAPDPQKN